MPVISTDDVLAAPLGGNIARVRTRLLRTLSTERTASDSVPMVVYHPWQTELRPLIRDKVSLTGVTSTPNRTPILEVALDLEQHPSELIAAIRELAGLRVSRDVRDLLDAQLTGRSPQMTVAVACSVVIVAAWALRVSGRY